MTHTQTQGAEGAGTKTDGGVIAARTLAGMLRSRIERAAEHKSETVSLGQFFADQIHRYLAEAGNGPEHDARGGDVPADGGDPDCDRGRDWGLRARQVHLEALSKRAAGGKWFASTNGADGLAQLDNGTDGMFPVRGEWHEIEFVEALVNAYRNGDLAAPAPSSPGVPDSVREAVQKLDAICGDGGNFADWHLAEMDAFMKCLEHVRTLLSTHPAGQSTGTGADLRLVPVEPTEEMLNAPLPVGSSITGARYESRRDLRPLIYAAMIGAAHDSTRTGDEGTEEARLIGPKMTPEQEERIAHNLCGEFGPDAVMANAAFVKAFYAELYAAARPEAPSDAGWVPIDRAKRDGTVYLLGFYDGPEKTDDHWCAVEGWYEAGIADRCWYDVFNERIEPAYFRERITPPSDPAPSGQAEG